MKLKSNLILRITGLFFLIFSLLLIFGQNLVQAGDCDDYNCNKDNQETENYLSCVKDKRSCLENKISQTRQESITLANTISILSDQIYVQQLQIEQTQTELNKLEEELTQLNIRLEGLEVSLDELSAQLVLKIQADYKNQVTANNSLLIFSNSLNNLISNLRYLKKSEEHITRLLHQAELQRLNYDNQKQLKEEKQAEVASKKNELEVQKQELDKQKQDQEYLLVETKHSESRYQAELEKTLAELEAIQSIIAGQGNESEVGTVSEGEVIAGIIPGASACSTGTHLHFEVAKDGAHVNPADYLKGADIIWNISQSDNPFSFNGSWSWPVEDAARITQGYGMTWYAAVKRAYGGAPHTGIDMLSKSAGNYNVKAVKEGTLYRGSIPCGGGNLRYVRVEHKDGGYNSYYLHINY